MTLECGGNCSVAALANTTGTCSLAPLLRIGPPAVPFVLNPPLFDLVGVAAYVSAQENWKRSRILLDNFFVIEGSRPTSRRRLARKGPPFSRDSVPLELESFSAKRRSGAPPEAFSPLPRDAQTGW